MKRLILWDFARATWQYDVVVALILAFIFLTPRELFKDQPRAASVVRLPAEHGATVFWIESDLMQPGDTEALVRQASDVVSSRTGKRTAIVRVETIRNAEEEIQGFMAYQKP